MLPQAGRVFCPLLLPVLSEAHRGLGLGWEPCGGTGPSLEAGLLRRPPLPTPRPCSVGVSEWAGPTYTERALHGDLARGRGGNPLALVEGVS